MRHRLGLWVGKTAIWLSRLLRRGGSSFPGAVARRIDPGLLTYLARQSASGNVLITGTNGKTTTANMLASIARTAGYDLTHNHAGANLISGLTTAYIDSAHWTGRVLSDLGILEVDEATVPRAAAEVEPAVLVATNFFRDQLDRFGELENTVRLVRKGLRHLAPKGSAVLNADDPLAASLASDRVQTLFFGIELPDLGSLEPAGAIDVKHCLICGHPYRYSAYFYAHLGHYRCGHCGWDRPEPEVALTGLEQLGPAGSRLQITLPDSTCEVRLAAPGLYNVYNALAAAAAAVALGFKAHQIARGLSDFSAPFGRMERIPVGDKAIFLALVKNPTGFDEVLRTVMADRGVLLLVINDRYADGIDVSWLWDVNFEQLARHQGQFRRIVCSGTRAEDMAVRLKYAGIDSGRVAVEPQLEPALERGLEALQGDELLYVLPTYTALLELRQALSNRGLARPFWQRT